MAEVLREQTRAVRREPGCLYIQGCRQGRFPSSSSSSRGGGDEPAFQVHADLRPRTGSSPRWSSSPTVR
jgi:hypothetical protein